jgi:hypothetical protein
VSLLNEASGKFDARKRFLAPFGNMPLWNILGSCAVLLYISRMVEIMKSLYPIEASQIRGMLYQIIGSTFLTSGMCDNGG